MMHRQMPCIEETPYKGKALLITCDNKLVVYRASMLNIFDIGTERLLQQIKLPVTFWKRCLSKIRLFERALHLETRWGIELDENVILIQYNHMVLRINILNGEVEQEKVDVRGNSLSVCKVFEVEGFDNQVVIGDYGKNSDRDEVKLYGRSENGIWRVLFSFEPGRVRHIHACVTDKEHSCVYILTGDLDNESGIWIAKDNFRIVKPLFVGKQMYRACKLFSLNENIVYVTDSPSEENYVYKIDKDVVLKKSRIEGTCIYGVCDGHEAFISTTCEPDVFYRNRFEYWLSKKPGKGIVDKKVCIGHLDDDGRYKLLKEFKHDGLPLRLFQYGTATFSNIKDNILYFSTSCVNEYDNCIFRIKYK